MKVIRKNVGVKEEIKKWNLKEEMIKRKDDKEIEEGWKMIVRKEEIKKMKEMEIGVMEEKEGIKDGVLKIVNGKEREIGEEIKRNEKVRKI